MYLLKKTEFKKASINLNSTINDAIKSLNNSELKIVIVLKKNKLVGTIVDGDIRRGLLKGLNLNDKISKVLNRKPLTVNVNVEKNEAIYLMKEKEIQQMPILDEKKNIVGLYINQDLMVPVKRNTKFIIMA